jgi:CheY-like chemotaxis protein
MEPVRKLFSMLIAEDDQAAREMLASVLVRKYPGVTVHLAGDGSEALELFRKHLPELTITDVVMPEMDGLRMAMQIRSIKADAKLIVLTGLSDLAVFDDLARAGVTIDHRIMKPIDFLKLFDAIEQCVAEGD